MKQPFISLLPNSSHSSYGDNNSMVGLLMWMHIGKPFDSIRLAAQKQGDRVGNESKSSNKPYSQLFVPAMSRCVTYNYTEYNLA